MKTRRYLVIDANNVFWRLYHRPWRGYQTRTPSGIETGAIWRMLAFLKEAKRMVRPTHMAIAFDSPRANTYRKGIDGEYKGGRAKKPESGEWQLKKAHKLCKLIMPGCLYAEGYEADDVVASFVELIPRRAEVLVATTDKDLHQLITDRVSQIDPFTWQRLDWKGATKKWGVTPDLIAEVMTLSGDAVDGVPGVPGIGFKRAAEIVKRHGTAEEAQHRRTGMPRKSAEALGNADIKAMRALVELKRDIPIHIRPQDSAVSRMDWKNAEAALWKLGLGALLPKASLRRS